MHHSHVHAPRLRFDFIIWLPACNQIKYYYYPNCNTLYFIVGCISKLQHSVFYSRVYIQTATLFILLSGVYPNCNTLYFIVGCISKLQHSVFYCRVYIQTATLCILPSRLFISLSWRWCNGNTTLIYLFLTALWCTINLPHFIFWYRSSHFIRPNAFCLLLCMQWRGHGWVWVGSNPPTFKKGTQVIIANPKTFFWGGVREKKRELTVRLC